MNREELIKNLMELVLENKPDSLEIGTPGRGGCVKIYGDFSKKEEFQAKIDNAIELAGYANAKIPPSPAPKKAPKTEDPGDPLYGP